MDPWLIFAELCRRVVEDQNVILNVYFGATGIEMSLTPLDESDFEELE